MVTTAWITLAFILILFFFFIFSLLDGFDLGIGMLIPFVKDKSVSGKMLSLIAPFWDGNEVWLVIAAGFTFATFPLAYGIALSALYLPLVLIIVSLILRAASIEFSYHDAKHKTLWRSLLSIGSLGVAFFGLFGIGILLNGLTIDKSGHATGTLTDFVQPVPFLFASCVTGFVLWYGCVYTLARQYSKELYNIARFVWMFTIMLFVCLSAFLTFQKPVLLSTPLFLIGGIVFLTALLCARPLLAKGAWSYRLSQLSISGLWAGIGAVWYPYSILSRSMASKNISLAQGAAPVSSLKLIVTIALVLTPVILLYTFFIYRIFHRTTKETA